jgi:heme-degrading monooxygenase HmoA
MAVKIIIKRKVIENRAEALLPLLKQLRNLAMNQDGYISGETLKRIDAPGENLVISTWQSLDAWRAWVLDPQRIELQTKVDELLGEQTKYELYEYS